MKNNKKRFYNEIFKKYLLEQKLTDNYFNSRKYLNKNVRVITELQDCYQTKDYIKQKKMNKKNHLEKILILLMKKIKKIIDKLKIKSMKKI